jgi:hypothetical protein
MASLRPHTLWKDAEHAILEQFQGLIIHLWIVHWVPGLGWVVRPFLLFKHTVIFKKKDFQKQKTYNRLFMFKFTQPIAYKGFTV